MITSPPHYPEWKTHDGYGHWAHKRLERGLEVTRLRHMLPSSSTGVARLLSEISFGVRLMFTDWGRPDAVVLVSPALFSCAVALMRANLFRGRIPTVLWVQDVYGLGMVETGSGSHRVGSLMTKIEGRTMRSAKGVAVIHDRFKARLIQRMNSPSSNINVIRNWSHRTPPASINRIAIRQKMNWAEDTTVVLHAGNMGVKQGLENVVCAARLAHERGEKVLFVLFAHPLPLALTAATPRS